MPRSPLSDRAPGLYLHIPFCSAVCPYCDFAVEKDRSPQLRRRLHRQVVDGLLAEARLAGPSWQETRPFDTMYLGGGTPSVLTPEELGRLLVGLREALPIAPDAWILLEANPEDASPERLAGYRSLGVRTLSLGVQSFDPSALRFLGRRHTTEEAQESLRAARKAGFETVSLDLIFGLPDQPLPRLTETLETAVALAPDHISGYQLTFHEGTPFGTALERGRLAELPEPGQAEAFEEVHRVLGSGGYRAYEVSNFARAPEHRSRHNTKYWDHTPYLGLGPSAHSFDGRRRWWNERDRRAWEARLDRGERPRAGDETLTRDQLALERLYLALRTADGLDLEMFRERYGVDLEETDGSVIEGLEVEGLIERVEAGGRPVLRPTRTGLAVADGLTEALTLS